MQKIQRIIFHGIGLSANDPSVFLDRRQIAVKQRAQVLSSQEMLTRIQEFAHHPVFSIIMPVYNPPEEIFVQTLDSVIGQVYPHWELCIANDASPAPHVRPILDKYQQMEPRLKVIHLSQNKGISGASNAALSLAEGEYISLVDHDDLIVPDTLFEVAQRINEMPDIDFVYTDSAIVDMEGKLVGCFLKPDFNWDLFLCHNWVAQLSTMRRSLVEQVGGWTEGREGQDYDLFLRCIEQSRVVSHIHKILYYWRQAPASISVSPENKPRTQGDQREVLQDCMKRLKIKGDISDLEHFMFRIHRPFRKDETVSLIVCLGDSEQSFLPFLKSLVPQIEGFNVEIMLLGDQMPASMIAVPGGIAVELMEYDHSQTVPANLNRAVRESKGEQVCFVFQPFHSLHRDWLAHLMEQVQRPEIGLVAGKLINNRNGIETAGVVLSQQGPLNIFHNEPSDATGDTNSLISLRSYWILSGNLAMISKQAFEEMEGFDESYQTSYFDYDLCLRLDQQGFRNLYTPFVTLQLHDSDNFDQPQKNDDFARFSKQWQHLFGKDGNLNFALQEALLEMRMKKSE
ncbi:MAG: glycosyltransferase [SAR324 cluster bacterium]|nr:glycosyltransferase [SAR324 cluster bacterium]